MKSLLALALLQTGILFVLLFEFVLSETGSGIAQRTTPVTMSGDVRSNTQPPNHFYASEAFPDEDRFRRIIRQELAAIVDGQPVMPPTSGEAVAPYTEAMTGSWEQRESVSRRLEYHTSVERISNRETQKLHGEIAKLDKAGQREMLLKLTRALNSGQLEGHL